jgi:glucose/arabinose dehydrogenase
LIINFLFLTLQKKQLIMKKILLSVLVLSFYSNKAQTVAIQSFATGFSNAIAIVHPPADSRFFVVQKTGAIRILNANGTVNATNFLTVSGLSSGSEQGLLGLAFHPNYATNGIFFINYTNTAGDTVIAKYTVSANPNVANTTATILMTIDQPYSNHNGGSLAFGADGYLYIGLGDGGSGGDPQGYAQNLTVNSSFPSRVFLGKMLRLDVDSATPYGIPPTNPFVGQAGKEEIWAYGLRNPWKFSFNRLNGDLWIADVGQSSREEINKTTFPFQNTGLNYGWRCYEGSIVYNNGGCPTFSNTVAPFTDYIYGSNGRCSITGGYFYTGSMYPNFANKYIFGDYCTGEIGLVSSTGIITWALDTPNSIPSFGEDLDGELYITNGSTVSKIVDTSLSNATFENTTISVYPNPAKTAIFIKNTSETTLSKVKIFDLTGKLVLTKAIENNNSQSVTISDLSSGLYLISVEDLLGNQYKSKLIVE